MGVNCKFDLTHISVFLVVNNKKVKPATQTLVTLGPGTIPAAAINVEKPHTHFLPPKNNTLMQILVEVVT